MKKISFVIPCYRSEKTINLVIEEIIQVMNKHNDYNYEIICVSDASPDQVFSVIRELAKKNPCVKGIELIRNFGQHAALMAGYTLCHGDIIISLDDDGQIPVDEVFKLIDKINSGYDVVYGTYEHKQHNLFRNFGTCLNNVMAEWLIGKPKEIMLTSYFAMTSLVLKEVLRYNQPFPYIMGLVLRTTNSIGAVPVNHRKRVAGESNYTLKKLINLWLNGFTAFSVKPLRIATGIGFLTSFLGIIYAFSVVINKLMNPFVPIGWSSIIIIILILGGFTLLSLGLIGEYIGRIYICINQSPMYIIREIVGVEKISSD